MRVYSESFGIRTQVGHVKHKQEALLRAPAIPKNSYCFAQHLKSEIQGNVRLSHASRAREKYAAGPVSRTGNSKEFLCSSSTFDKLKRRAKTEHHLGDGTKHKNHIVFYSQIAMPARVSIRTKDIRAQRQRNCRYTIYLYNFIAFQYASISAMA